MGFSYPTSIASFSNDLFVSNSGDGTISKVISDGTITTHATGFSAPGGPYGISTNTSGTLYTVDHRTGQVFSVGSDGLLTPIGAVSPSGGVFTAFDSYLGLLVSDVIQGIIYEFDLTGNRSVFASGFTGKNTPPVIGPAGLIFDTVGNLYVGDGDSVWRFSFVPEPTTLALMGLGLAGIGYRRHRSKIAV